MGARNPAHDFPLPSQVTRYCIDGTASFAMDFMTGERRYGITKDTEVSLLFIALIIFLLLQPFLTSAPFSIADVIVIFALGMICFIPCGLFARAVLAGSKKSPA